MEPVSFPYLEAELKENIFDSRHRLLIIDDRFISFDDKIMACEDITNIRYGSMQMLVFHKLRTDKYYRIELKDKKENTIKIFFGHSKLSKDNGEKEENYDTIINSLWHAVKKRLVNEALEKINKGEELSAGIFTLLKDGVRINQKGFLRNREIFIPWNDVNKKIDYGRLYIRSKTRKRIKCRISFLHTWNSVVLYSVLEFLQTRHQSGHLM